MFGYEEIKLNLAYDSLYFILALIVIAAYTIYVYRYTIPPVSKIKKIVLISLRTAALLCILFIFFEPVLSFTKKFILEPVNLIFVDNSRSMTIEDGTNREESVRNIAADFVDASIAGEKEFYLFGTDVRELPTDSLNKINFEDGITNIAKIFSLVQKEDNNFASITLITDGVITAGSNPVYTADKLSIPVFTIGIGDTTQRKDVLVKRVLYNHLLYQGTPTTIIATLQNNGLSGKDVRLSLYENNILIEQKPVTLSETGIQNESFEYTPNSSGEKKLSVVVSKVKDEFTTANNKKVFYVKVLSNKIKVLVLAGTPSTDLTFIKNTLRSDKNLTVQSIVQISKDRFLNDASFALVDSADIIFMVGFPANDTPLELLNKVKKRIENDRVPFFIAFTPEINTAKLLSLQKELPFTFKQSFGSFRKVQPQIFEDQRENPVIQNSADDVLKIWNNLPPVVQREFNFVPKPEAKVISKTKVNNVVLNDPLIISRSFNGKRSIAVLAGEIWRWKLQTATKNTDVFDRFIINSVRWLNTPEEEKRVSIKTSKKIYTLGERIEFTAQVNDEALNPVPDAIVKIKIKSDNETYEVELQSVGKGLYEGSIQINKKGDYKFTGTAELDGTMLGKDAGTFNVGELDIEMITPRMNYEFLSLLAKKTNGKFFTADNYERVFGLINSINERSKKEKLVTSEITLWSSEWLMIIAIFFFSLEWFLRKRAGML